VPGFERRTPPYVCDGSLSDEDCVGWSGALGHPLLDDYLEFVAARARPNTLIAVAYDLKVFFTVIVKQPADITTADVLTFIKAQRDPRRGTGVVRLEDGEAGLSARTIKRRLASLSGLFAYLIARADAGVDANPVPRGLATRGRRGRAGAGHTVDPCPADAAAGARACGGRRVRRRPSHATGSGDGRGDAARRPAAL
jgi:hypothetical protein